LSDDGILLIIPISSIDKIIDEDILFCEHFNLLRILYHKKKGAT
jgi:hypothetical protein